MRYRGGIPTSQKRTRSPIYGLTWRKCWLHVSRRRLHMREPMISRSTFAIGVRGDVFVNVRNRAAHNIWPGGLETTHSSHRTTSAFKRRLTRSFDVNTESASRTNTGSEAQASGIRSTTMLGPDEGT